MALAPDFVQARFNLALVQIQQQRVPEGLATLGEVIDRDPTFTTAYLVRGQAHIMARQPEQAIPDLEHVLTRDPENAQALWLLGQALARLGREDEAQRALCRSRDLGHPQAAAYCKD